MTTPQGPENPVARSLDEISTHLQQLSAQLRAAGPLAPPAPSPAPPAASASPAPPAPPAASAPPAPPARPAPPVAPVPVLPYHPHTAWAHPGWAQPDWGRPAWGQHPVPPMPPAPPERPIPPRVPPAAPQAPQPGLWERLSRDGAGSRVLAWIGGGVTLAGVVLLLVLAVQRGWLGPEARVGTGAALGLALAALGIRLHRTSASAVGALAVTATGTAVVYLDVLAATALYHFLPTWAGLAAGLAIAAPGLALAARWHSQLFATCVLSGAALSAPFVTMRFDALLTGFLIVLQLAATPVQLRRRWPALALVAAVPPAVAALLDAGLHHGSARAAVFAAATAVLQLVLATLVARKRADDVTSLALVLVAALPALLLAADGVPRYTTVGLLTCVTVAFAIVVAGHLSRLVPLPAPFVTGAAGAGAAMLFEATVLAWRGDVRAVCLLAGAMLFAVLAGRIRQATALWVSIAFAMAGIVLALAGTVRPRDLALAPAGVLPRSDVLTLGATSALLAVTAVAIGWATTRLHPAVAQATVRACWCVAAPVVLYGATGVGVAAGLLAAPTASGFHTGHVIVTVSWTVVAFALLLRHRRSTSLRVAALTLVAAAVAKLVLFDLASLSGLARVLAFLGAGLVLLAAGERYAKQAGMHSAPRT